MQRENAFRKNVGPSLQRSQSFRYGKGEGVSFTSFIKKFFR